ncbi:MAG: hypothetical protein AB2L24_13440 [Mangrovibacterium sp.]
MVTNCGSFIISLDFELLWGVRDKLTIEKYGTNILGVKEVIPLMVKLFEQYGVKATIAAVGLLFCRSKKEIGEYLPNIKPNYTNKNLSPFENNYIESLMDEADPYHSAYKIIDQLKTSQCIEIATHTFGHYYCWEPDQTIREFEADIQSAIKIARNRGIEFRSIVFPRNQVSKEYLNVCLQYGINTYRGNPANFFEENGGVKNKIMRFLDTYLPLGSDTTYSYSEIKEEDLYNVKASRFLKPYSPYIALFDKLKLTRIKNEMTRAAKQNKIYHLWWHPHNFGVNRNQNLSMLEDILKHYRQLSEKYGFKSYTMNELSNLLFN